ncbi:MAG: multicopper oxidase domain-containing protein [Nitrososphaeraceae archaeon]
MISKKEACCSIFNGKRRMISLAVLSILLLSIITMTTVIVSDSKTALAQSQSGSSIPPSSNDIGGSNNTIANKISEQQGRQLQQQQNQLPSSTSSSSSQQPRTHEYTLIAENTTLEIAPGLRVDAWTYNGTVPGPTLTATEGDRVIIHFKNKTPLPHTVHLHGDHPSEQDGVFEQIGPNGTYTYDVIAQPAGALAYHCHVPPVMQHVRMGLYGAFIVYPKTPLPPAREYVFVNGEYDTQNQLNPLPEYYFFNGYTELYQLHPLPAMTNETVRIYLINLGLSPAYGIHIHGSLFKVHPSGILENPTLKVQSWELASGNTAILEAKWPWPGKFTFHYHGIPEERGAMGYFNVTNPPANAVDGKNIAITKSINMNDWQMNLTKSLQKADPHGKITTVSTSTNGEHRGMMMGGTQMGMEKHEKASSSSTATNNATQVSIVKGATTLGDKAFSPSHVKVKVGGTIIWTNDDSNIHTATSGVPNAPNAGQVFDSGLTSLISPSKTYSHKFTNPGEFSYFCRLHPTMMGEIEVTP